MISKMETSLHPRPDFSRNNWEILNGYWNFCFDDKDVGMKEQWFSAPDFNLTINVPFSYQSERSGIKDKGIHSILWYSTAFNLSDSIQMPDIHLCFGAVDYHADVWVNGIYVGGHTGGYTPFRFYIGDLLHMVGENTVTVRVEDKAEPSQPRGKQYWKPQNEMCWYQPSSGIWQSVWLEGAGKTYIKQALITPDIDRRCAELELATEGLETGTDYELQITLTYENECKTPGSFSNDWRYNMEEGSHCPVGEYHFTLNRKRTKFVLSFDEKDYIKDIHFWWPHAPNLYGADLKLIKNGSEIVDQVHTYFGMRKVEIKNNQILLNHQPLYQKLVLDQGYWSETHLTPPDGDALKADIEAAQKMGFNGARKHQKIEDPRYYYWADMLGFLVWGELPSAYHFDRDEQSALMSDMKEFVERDYNHPCIIAWVPLNESWGVRNIYCDKAQQNFAAALYYQIKFLDSTRFVGNNDGWEQVMQTDFYGIHDYTPVEDRLTPAYESPQKLLAGTAQTRACCAEGHPGQEKPILITEYGGIAFNDQSSDSWGYFGKVQNEEEFLARYENITRAFQKIPYIQGYCYTQLTDVYQEKNGLMTMNRQYKVDPELIRSINNGECRK